jgi:hypothetical protein
VAKKALAPQPAPLDELGFRLLSTLLADLIDPEENYVRKLTQDLRRFELPDTDDYKFFSLAIKEIYERYPLAPTEKAIADALTVRGIPDAAAKMEYVRQFRARTPEQKAAPAIRMAAHSFTLWYKRLNKIRRLEKALEIAKNPRGMDEQQEHAAITRELAQVSPTMVRVETMTIPERHRWWIDRQEALFNRDGDQGKAVHPMFPFESLNDAVPGLRPSNPVMIGAQSKWGKTVVGDVCAEFMAWEGGFAVNVIALETDFGDYDERFMARHMGIPSRYFGSAFPVTLGPSHVVTVGPIRPSDTRWNPYIGDDAIEKFVERRNKGGGIIAYTRIKGGGTAEEVVGAMTDFQLNVAEPAGKKAVFIIDYLQKISYNPNLDQHVGIANNAAAIKDGFDALGCYGILLSQEHIGNPENGVEKAKNRQTASFGSTMPMMLTQTYISLQRPNAKEDEAVVVGRNNERLYNAVGDQRFWARKDSPSGVDSKLVVVASNYGRTGAVVPIVFEGELYNCMCPKKIALQDCDWRLPRYATIVDEHYS